MTDPRQSTRLAWLVLTGALALQACRSAAKPPPKPPPPEVSVVTVTPTAVDEAPEFVGQVQAFRTVQVRAQVSGVVIRRSARATQVQALRSAYAMAEMRYETGVSSYLDVLDAQRSLFGAQLALVQVQGQYLIATVDLYRALGGGWPGR